MNGKRAALFVVLGAAAAGLLVGCTSSSAGQSPAPQPTFTVTSGKNKVSPGQLTGRGVSSSPTTLGPSTSPTGSPSLAG